MARPYKNYRRKSKFSRPSTWVGLVALAVVVGVLIWLFGYRHNSQAPVPKGGETVNPISETPKEPTKTDTGGQTDHAKAAPVVNNKKQATVVISNITQSGDTVTVRGFMNNIYENGGQCTATFSRDGYTSVSGSSSAEESVSYTSCDPIKINSKKLTAGTWQLKLTYTSADATGSAQQSVTIQ